MIIKKILYELFKGTPFLITYKKYYRDEDIVNFIKNESAKYSFSLDLHCLIYGYFHQIKVKNFKNSTINKDIEYIELFLLDKKNEVILKYLFYFYCYNQLLNVLNNYKDSSYLINLMRDKYPNIKTYYDYLKICIIKEYPVDEIFIRAFDWNNIKGLTYYELTILSKEYDRQLMDGLIHQNNLF